MHGRRTRPTRNPDVAALGHRFAPLAVLLLALVSFGIGLASLPVQDRDEARFAQASRQMAATGDLIDIRLQDAPRHNKPALIYWAQSAAIWITGASGETPIWVHRLPSYFAGVLSALAMIWAGTPIVGRRAAVLAGIMCATVYMLHAEARTAKTDAALLLSVILTMGALSRAYLKTVRNWTIPAIFWTALAAGFLLKGPMVALPVVGLLVWMAGRDRGIGWLARLRPLPGLIWFAALVSPWFIAITIVTDGAFWGASVGTDLSDKITAGGEHSGSPPGFYLLTIWLTFWPWSVLLPIAAVHAWRSRMTAETALLLGWLIPAWLTFEAVPVKLLHYTLPLYPPLMFLAAAALLGVLDGRQSWRGWPVWLATAGFLAGLAFFLTIMVVAPLRFGAGLHLASLIGALVMAAAAFLALVSLWRAEVPRAIVALAVAGLAMGITLTAATLPAARDLWVSDRLVDAMAASSCLTGPVAIAGYAEPSVVFLLGTETVLTDLDGALAYLAEGTTRAAWIAPDLLDTPPPAGIPGLTQVDAIGIGNFRPVTLRLFVSPGLPAADLPCPD